MTDEQYNSIMAELAEIKRRLPKQETTIRGTLTRDAEARTTAKGKAFTKFNIKCSEQHNGSKYVNAIYWGNLRVIYAKGDRIVLKGDFEAFKGKDGKELMSFKISEIVSAERAELKSRYDNSNKTDSDDVPF